MHRRFDAALSHARGVRRTSNLARTRSCRGYRARAQNSRSRARIDEHVAEQEALLRASQETERRYRTLIEQVPAITYLEVLDGDAMDNAYFSI